jgi:hypothetical protein
MRIHMRPPYCTLPADEQAAMKCVTPAPLAQRHWQKYFAKPQTHAAAAAAPAANADW